MRAPLARATAWAALLGRHSYLKLIPYTLMGALDGSNLLTSVVLMPLAPIGVKLGYMILNRVSQKAIYRFFYIALFLSGIKLLLDGIGLG